MGFGGVSPLSLILILVIILVLFGAKRLRSIGTDLGVAVKSFRQGMDENDEKNSEKNSIKNSIKNSEINE